MKKVIRIGLIVAVLLVSAAILACPWGSQNLKQFSDMSPKERATFFMKVYNSQFDDYQVQSARADLTDDQVKVLSAKRDALEAMHPMIKAYDLVVNAGAIPDTVTEQQILDLINQLAAMAI